MKTYVAEPMPDLFWQEIKKNFWESHFSTIDKKDAEIVIIRTQTKADVLFFDHFPILKMIIRAGTGFDNIDLNAAEKKKIVVCNTPEANAISAYEHTMSFIFALLKQHKINEKNLLSGNWKTGLQNNWELSDLKALIIGVGRVGTRVAKALQYFGAEVKGVDPYLSELEWQEKQIDSVTFKEGVSWCNLISFHCPLTVHTFHYFGSSILEDIQQPVWLINTARGEIVDNKVVEEGLESNQILGFAADVFDREPPELLRFYREKKVYLSPHTGSFTLNAKYRMSFEVLKVWETFNFSHEILNNVFDLKYL